VIDGAYRLDELFGPRDWFEILGQIAEPRGKCCDWRGDIQIALVGSPAECGAQIGQFGGEPVVSLALPWIVPHGEDVGFALREVLFLVSRMCTVIDSFILPEMGPVGEY
jgi:hypothetical protein